MSFNLFRKWLLIAALIAMSFSSLAEPSPVRVGSKAFTESVILGDMVQDLIQSTGTPAIHRKELGGTRILWDALRSGEIDIYPEYTGTLTQELLHTRNIAPALSRMGLAMSAPLGFNNEYAIGMRASQAKKLGIRTISDLAGHPELRIGLSNEFRDRADGWPGLRADYRLPQKKVAGMDHDIALRALKSGEIDVTDLYSTDAEIKTFGLRVLKDDRHFFPTYAAVLLYRKELESRPRALQAALQLTGSIPEEKMVSMNARAKFDHVPEAKIASDFVERHFGISVGYTRTSVWKEIWLHLKEHLRLVIESMVPAILVAIPLGIIAAGSEWAAQIILGALGIIQTIPALALLVFLIQPLKSLGLPGIGNTPAIIALFLYSLLPIARNTHAGLTGIPPHLRESAEALGLLPYQKLGLIELPLASPTLLAGIKTAAVINVGFATLGALVGAGGLGQPILTGIRLDDYSLILQGAVPAALLALAVQGAFELAERVIVPRGLRL